MTSRADSGAAASKMLPTLTASPDPIAASGGSQEQAEAATSSALHATAGSSSLPTSSPSASASTAGPSIAVPTSLPNANTASAKASYPSPASGLVPPPADEDSSWQPRMALPPTARQGKRADPATDVSLGSSSTSASTASTAADMGGASTPTIAPGSAQAKRASAASSVAGAAGIGSAAPPVRPSPIPASMETAERIASAASSRRGSAVVTGDELGLGGGTSPAMRPLSGSRRSSSTRGSKRISNLSLSSRTAGGGVLIGAGEGADDAAQGGAGEASNRLSVGGSSSRRASRSPAGLSTAQAKHLSTASSRSGGQLSPTSEHPPASASLDPKRASTASGSAVAGAGTGTGGGGGGGGASSSGSAAGHGAAAASTPRRRVQRGTSYLSTATSARTSLLLGPEARHIKIRDFGFAAEDPRHFGVSERGDEDMEEEEEEHLDDEDTGGQWSAAHDRGADTDDEPATVASPEEHDYEGWQSHQGDGGEYEGGGDGPAPPAGLPHGWYLAAYAFVSESEHELTVQPGERLLVVGALDGGWAIVERDVGQDETGGAEGKAERGLVPEGYLQWLGEGEGEGEGEA